MDTVKAWCLSGCIALVIGSICTMIVPSIEKYKIIKLTISAFILAGIVVPVSKNIDSINIDMTEQTFVSEVEESEMSDNTFNLLKENVAESLFPLVKYELHMLNISDDFGVNVELEKEKEGISVEALNITISDLHKNKKDEIKLILEKNLGLPVVLEVV